MIDRRRFVQQMIVLGAAAGFRPATLVSGAPPDAALKDLADAALAAAKAGGASVRRHPDQSLPQPVHLHARPPRPEHRQHGGLRLWRARDRRWDVGLLQQQPGAEGRSGPRRAAGARDRAREQAGERRAGPSGAREGVPGRVEHAGQEEPVRHADSAQAGSAAADPRGGVEGARRKLRERVHAIRQRAEVLRLFRWIAHRAVAHPVVSLLPDHGRRQGRRQVLQPRIADSADGHRLRVRRGVSPARGGARRGRRSGGDAQGQAGACRVRRR